METHLKINHLAPYLPYELIMRDSDGIYKEDRILIFENMKWLLSNGQPILRPLSDLTKKEYRCLFYGNPLDYKIDELPYRTFTKLLELHFDVFHLIPQGLAIDKNKLAQLK